MVRRFLSTFVVTALLTTGLAIAATTTNTLPSASTSSRIVLSPDVTPTVIKAIKQLVHNVNPTATIKQITDSPFPGIKTVVADNSVLYASNNGRYLLFGDILDTKKKVNLTDTILGKLRVHAIASIPSRDFILFKPKRVKTRYTVTVFTDTSCEFCRALFQNTQGYLKEGIAIRYVPWPRMGMQAPNLAQMKSVWCAKNRDVAYTRAMSGKSVKPATCRNSKDFANIFALGQQLGINGTPAVFDSSGKQIGGFLPPIQMLAKLQQLAPTSKS